MDQGDLKDMPLGREDFEEWSKHGLSSMIYSLIFVFVPDVDYSYTGCYLRLTCHTIWMNPTHDFKVLCLQRAGVNVEIERLSGRKIE